jgi:hypothetical protein
MGRHGLFAHASAVRALSSGEAMRLHCGVGCRRVAFHLSCIALQDSNLNESAIFNSFIRDDIDTGLIGLGYISDEHVHGNIRILLRRKDRNDRNT